jgi:hypothetical protein
VVVDVKDNRKGKKITLTQVQYLMNHYYVIAIKESVRHCSDCGMNLYWFPLRYLVGHNPYNKEDHIRLGDAEWLSHEQVNKTLVEIVSSFDE